MVRKALSAVARVDRRDGLIAAVKLLAGLPDPRLTRAGLDRSPTFGALQGHPEAWLTGLLRRCVTAGWVDFADLDLFGNAGREARGRAHVERPGGDDSRRLRCSRRCAGSGSSSRGRRACGVRRRERPTLRDVALLRPRTLGELTRAHGIGDAKAERYGRRVLETVARATAS